MFIFYCTNIANALLHFSFTFKVNSDIIYVFNLFVKITYSTEQWEKQPKKYEKLVNRFVKEEKMSKNFNEEIAEELKNLGGRLVLIEDKDKGTASDWTNLENEIQIRTHENEVMMEQSLIEAANSKTVL